MPCHCQARRTSTFAGPASYLIFFFPALAIFAWLGWEFFLKSFGQNERIVTSPWLPIVWPFKFMMSLSAVLLLLQGVSEFVKCWERASGPGADEPEIVSAGADGEAAT